jgi:hypothetical protein
VTNSNGFHVSIIGDRINPGFKSTKVLFDKDDLAGTSMSMSAHVGRPTPPWWPK